MVVALTIKTAKKESTLFDNIYFNAGGNLPPETKQSIRPNKRSRSD